jgi:hypothetical protein
MRPVLRARVLLQAVTISAALWAVVLWCIAG